MEQEFIKETIEQFFKKLSVNAEISTVDEDVITNIKKFNIKAKEPSLLIGYDGKILIALNHLIKKIYEKEKLIQGFEDMHFTIDVNNYQEKKNEDIKNKATMMAERARFFKNNVEMIPMNPYERMIVHSLFTESEDIETESTGKGRERRVVIKYTGEA